MTLQKDLEQAVTRVTEDSQTLHEIVHGDEQTVVITEGGDVSSPAKVIFDIEQQLQQQLTDLNVTLNALNDAVAQAQHYADNAEHQAQVATTAANSTHFPADLTDGAGKLLAVNDKETGYVLTQSSSTVYGFSKEGAKLRVHINEEYCDANSFLTYCIAPVGIAVEIDTRGHLLVTV